MLLVTGVDGASYKISALFYLGYVFYQVFFPVRKGCLRISYAVGLFEGLNWSICPISSKHSVVAEGISLEIPVPLKKGIFIRPANDNEWPSDHSSEVGLPRTSQYL